MILLFAVTFAAETFVAEAGESGSKERRYDEEPELRESECVLREECLRDGTCRVDRGVGQRNRDQVDQGQGQTDSQTTESTVTMLAVGYTKDNHEEDKRQYALGCESTPNIRLEITTCYICSGEEISVTVCSKRTDLHVGGFSDTEEYSSCCDSTARATPRKPTCPNRAVPQPPRTKTAVPKNSAANLLQHFIFFII